LLGYGVIFSKLEGEISQQKKITWLAILSLLFTALLEINQFIEIGQNSLAVIYISNGLYGIDSTIIGIKVAILLSVGVLLMSLNLTKDNIAPSSNYSKDYEFTLLILLSTLGMLLLISSKDLISLYLSIELISLSLYILAAIKRDGQFSTEAGIKYFLLGAVASGLLLFGSALIY